jgi:hypothetical protein
VPMPESYPSWSGAPKHWVIVPAQRHAPPADPQAVRPGGQRLRWGRGAVAAVTGAVAALIAHTGPGVSVADLDGGPPAVTAPAVDH